MKSWKTTLFGALIAAGAGLAGSDNHVVATIGKVLTMVGPVLLGAYAKDRNVTGGDVKQ